jgi:capsular exopolysaccharide synthesis family protein
VIDEGLPADYPIKPRKTKIVMMAVLASAAFAVGVILLLDWLDNTIKTPEDVEEKLRVPLLGHLPLDKSNKDETPFLGFLSEDNWHFAEAIRTIRTSFILSGLDKPAKVTVITSSVPNEGKSTVSLCIAHALGQMEKVLLIDADMRKPSVGKALDISLLTPGLSNLIAGTAELDECITTLPKSEVHVLTAGVVLGNPLDLIAGDRFEALLTMLKEKYDRILIDSAPVQAVSDSIVIATHADSLIYVVKSDGSSTPLIKKGLRRLSEANARFAGVVLNQVDVEKVKKQSGYESNYYDNYGYAYGDLNESENKS